MKRLYKIYSALITLLISTTSFAANFEMSSEDFLDKGVLPVRYTCDGKGVPPQITWSNPDKNTQSLILIMTSIDKSKVQKYHWILYNLPSNLKNLPEAMTKMPNDGPKVAKNSWGQSDYHSPCPERGGVQSYVFTLHALNKKLNIDANASPESIIDQIKNSIIQSGNLTAVYSRWPVPLN
jgi:hypothetical protein